MASTTPAAHLLLRCAAGVVLGERRYCDPCHAPAGAGVPSGGSDTDVLKKTSA